MGAICVSFLRTEALRLLTPPAGNRGKQLFLGLLQAVEGWLLPFPPPWAFNPLEVGPRDPRAPPLLLAMIFHLIFNLATSKL